MFSYPFKPGVNTALPASVVDTSVIPLGTFGDSTAEAASTNSSSTNYITNITRANPGVVTKNTHGFTTGDKVYHWGVQGMTQVNEQTYTVTVINANSYSIDVDTTNFSPYVANTWLGGKSYRRYNAVVSKNAQGPVSALGTITGQRFEYVHINNRGIGGSTSTDAINRMVTDLPVSLGLKAVIIKLPTNDAHAGVSAATMYNNILQVVDRVVNTLGAYAILCNAPPYTGDATANKDNREAYNAMLAAYNGPDKLIKVDTYSVLVDPATRDYKAGVSYDGVHLSPFGQMLEAQAIRDAIKPRLGDGAGFILRPNNLLLNPGMTGTGGTISSGTSGSLADSWISDTNAATGTRTLSKNGAGKQVMAVNLASGLTTGERLSIRQDVAAANLVVGTRYVAEMECTIDNFSGSGIWYEADLELRNNASAFAFDHARRNTDTLNIPQLIAESQSKTLLLRTLPVEFLSSWTYLRVRPNTGFNCVSGNALAQMTILNTQLYPVA